MGYHVEYFPSHSAAAAESPRRWDRRLRARLELLIGELEPDLLVFDGAHPYDALVAVLRAHRGGSMRTVWCRRPMWREGGGAEAIYWSGEFDAVLEPGELAESEDRGLTVARRDEAERVAPIVFLDPGELLSREEACAELGLDPERPHALVALGQGPELDRAVARCLEFLAEHPELQVAALESSLSPELRVPGEVVLLRGTYPMSRFYRAFDLAVAAAGYNAFHELLAHGVPSLFVPMPRQIDDQAARARWAQEEGVGRGLTGRRTRRWRRGWRSSLDPEVRETVRGEARGVAPCRRGQGRGRVVDGACRGWGSRRVEGPGEGFCPRWAAKGVQRCGSPPHVWSALSGRRARQAGRSAPPPHCRCRAKHRVTDPPPPPASAPRSP